MSFLQSAGQISEMQDVDSRRVVHLELHTGDLAAARRFYGQLFGWREEHVRTPVGSYLAVELGRTIGGGMVACPTGRALWLPYVEVGNIRETTDRAWLLGATVMLAPREGPAGWRSVVATAAAGEVALWQPK